MKLPSFLVGRKWVWLCTVLVGKRTNASRFLGWILNQRKTKWAGTGCKEPCQCPVDTHRPKEDFKCSLNLQMITKFGAFSALLMEAQIFSSKWMILCVCMWNKLTQGNQCIFLIDGYGAQSTHCGWRQSFLFSAVVFLMTRPWLCIRLGVFLGGLHLPAQGVWQ